MKRTDNDTPHQISEPTGSSSTSSGSTNAVSHGLGIAEHKSESASGDRDVEPRAVSSTVSQEQPESVTVLIEGGGFSFNDVFPMGSRTLAADRGRSIAKFALAGAPSRGRRSPGRTGAE